MDINKMKALSYDELRALYKNFLHSQNISTATINTAYVDTFYLWRKGSKDLFWNAVNATDFETEAKSALIKALSENSTGNVNSLVSGYLSHIRRFRLFLSSDETVPPVEYKRQSTAKVNPTHMSREIIINKMYVGAYLSEGDNIGHEIINLYKADDGKNYIYLNSQGTIELSHGENRITVLLVRKFASKTYKVLAKAEGVTILDFADSKLPREERYKGQVALGLTYGGISLVDLFNENLYHGSLQEEKNAYTTFVADKVIKPKNQIYITDDASVSGNNTFFIRTNKGFGKQTLREFYNENEKPDSFDDLNQIIENRELWEDANTTQAISELPELQKDPYFNFLKIIRQEDNELAFSNMFAYFFDINREAFSRFAREVLHIEVQTDFTIEREKRNIDLLISDKNNAVVIENKIKSSINGIDDRHDIYSDQVQSQLKKYYQFVTSDDEYRKKTPSCFIFSPNYNRIDLSKFSCGEKYTIIYYREIYNFFIEKRSLYDGVPYFDDFINAMYKHTKDYDNDLEEEMQRRFQNTICNTKKGYGGQQL
ncbi:PD-(D/E)XK nuclease family protein [Anaerocolumna xylanovorans]|uniref:PD-(D/E)XK nuclease superfamily protein n=1 Tax=Anaerocolumna xylanovorans DSM 12503 TaxID=1121345 RepID=A0A1M7XXT0_9FIRM|nr:PD-(D/E)XK nuclease family protein [Anaerocolumna xylanovorans]SHO43651.1 PD-(D/E)XK nuclease superfamily protein [Anaerocolumna xylanovorans DSM 12503]